MNENVNKVHNINPASQQMSSSCEEFSSASAEPSSDSGNAEKISTPPSIKQQKKSLHPKNKNNISSPSKPSSSIKRIRDPQEKQGTNPSSKKSKKPAQEDEKGKATAVPEVEKSAKKKGPIWNAKDEVAFLKRLVACCEEGKGLPKIMGVFYEAVKKDLDGDYSHDQLYNKLRGLKTRFGVAKDKIKDKGFVGFKNTHEETVYRLSQQVWGNREDEAAFSSEKAGKGGNARAEEEEFVVDMAVREHEEGDDNEEGEGHVHCDQNNNMKLKKMKTKEGTSHIAESVRNRVSGRGTGTSTHRSEENEKNSSEDEESESESSDKENSAGENSRRHVAEVLSDGKKVAAVGHHDARRNLTTNDASVMPDESRRIEKNVVHHVTNDMVNVTSCAKTADQHQLCDQLCKENSIILKRLLASVDGLKYEIANLVKKEVQGSSNTAITTGIDFSLFKGFPSAKELPLPPLSETQVVMLDQKRQKQQLIEMEVACNHLALLQEEYQLRLAKL